MLGACGAQVGGMYYVGALWEQFKTMVGRFGAGRDRYEGGVEYERSRLCRLGSFWQKVL